MNVFPSNSFIFIYRYSQLGYPTRELQDLQLIVFVVFGAMG